MDFIAESIGHEKGLSGANMRVAADLLREKMPLSFIEKISRLSEDAILNIAKGLGISVAR